MTRRFPWSGLVIGAWALLMAGCEPHHSWTHKDNDDDMMAKAAGVDSDSSSSSKKILGGSADDQDASSFFQGNTRSSGGLSSEARAIERNLGAY